MSLGRAASYEQVCLFKACAEIMIGQETKWPIPRNAKTHPVVAFRRRARAFAVLIVRAQKERRKSYANGDIRLGAERLPAFSLCRGTQVAYRYSTLDHSQLASYASKTRRKHKQKYRAAGSDLSGGSNGCERVRYGMRTTVRIWNDELLARTYWPSTIRHS
jgi:hypothetical protein